MVVDMGNFEKAYWSINGDSISLNMPIQKVDQEKRIVSGWATTDGIDKQGDIVDIAASEKAFENFRGNIREQHTPLAVGKMVSFKKDKYFDKSSGEFRNGIFVDVYISKGAQDTWYKVNEGVLSGFSIGGSITDAEEVYNKAVDAPVRMVKEYELYELSLVDNPANPDSNVVSIQKVNAPAVVEKNYLENVYFCQKDDYVVVSEKSEHECAQCGSSMTSIGFVESTDVEKSETIKSLISNHTQVSDTSENEAIDESIANPNEKEGNNVGILTEVTEEPVEKSAEPVEVEKSADEAVEETVEEAPEEAAEEEPVVEEPEAVADEVEKADAPADSNEDLAKAVTEINAFVADAVASLVETVKSITQELADLKKSIETNSETMKSVKSDVEKFGERVDSVEADTAVRKSGDLGGIVQEEKVQKSMWGGRFLDTADLYR